MVHSAEAQISSRSSEVLRSSDARCRTWTSRVRRSSFSWSESVLGALESSGASAMGPMRVFLHRDDAVDVRRTKLEDAGHPRDRGDGFDLHVHRIEDWALRLRPLEFELQNPARKTLNIVHGDVRAGILTNVADGLV